MKVLHTDQMTIHNICLIRYQRLILAVRNSENVSAREQILKISWDTETGSEENTLTIAVGISSLQANHLPHRFF